MQFAKKLINTIKEHFRLKLIICFILCAIFPLFILGAISYKISYTIAKDNMLKETKIACEKNQNLLENRMAQIESLADSIHFNLCVLCTTSEQPMSKYLDTLSSVRNNITSMADSFNIYHVNVFLPEDSFVSNEGITFCSLSEMKDYKVQISDFANQGIKPKWLFQKQVKFPYIVSKNKNPVGVLSCYRAAKINSQQYCFALHITSDELSYYLDEFSKENPSVSYIIDTEGTILASTDQKQIGTSLTNEKRNALTQNRETSHISYNECEIISAPVHNQLFLITETPDYYIRQSASILVKMIFVCFIIVVPLTMFAIIWVADQMTNKVNRLSHSMSELKMDDVIDATQINELVPEASSHLDEIDTLTVTCANMITELNASFESNLNLKIQEEKLNYQLLQSQINPHFLYNTLDSITWMIEGERNDEATFMISQLARLFRISLSKGKTVIRISEELQHSKSYMNIQQIRYKDRFQVEFLIDKNVEECCTVKLVVQPILENAINYGMSLLEEDEDGEIKVQVTKEEGTLILSVIDNGIGIPQEEIEFLLMDTNRVHKKGSGVGLTNVNNRIQILFGKEYGLKIESELDEGTTVLIRIPAIVYTEENRRILEKGYLFSKDQIQKKDRE